MLSLLWRARGKINLLHVNQKKPSLTWFGSNRKKSLAQDCRCCFFMKGIPLPASMTVEAALILPLMLFFFINLMAGVEMIRLHGNILAHLWQEGRVLAASGWIYGKAEEESTVAQLGGTLLTDWAVKQRLVQKLGKEYLDESPLTYGSNGLNTLESSYLENDCVDIKVTYRVSAPFDVIGFRPFYMANRYYARAWTGYAVCTESEDIVYVTPYGEVYHLDAECNYIDRTVEWCVIEEIGRKRNRDGRRYTICLQCGEGRNAWNILQQKVYYTPYGERYHLIRECEALKRTMLGILRSEALEKYRACGKCAE